MSTATTTICWSPTGHLSGFPHILELGDIDRLLDLDSHVGLAAGPGGALILRRPDKPGSQLLIPVHRSAWVEGELEETVTPYCQLSSETRPILGLPSKAVTYTAWSSTCEGVAYALPVVRPTITLALNPASYRALEAVALRHGVRARDILIAFAHDLGAAYADSREERFVLPSGGSDERDLAEAWFRRNVDLGDEVRGAAPQFLRSYREEDS